MYKGMDKKKRMSLIDRLDKKITEVIPDIQKKDKFKKLRNKFKEPISEKYDRWNDDMEVDI